MQPAGTCSFNLCKPPAGPSHAPLKGTRLAIAPKPCGLGTTLDGGYLYPSRRAFVAVAMLSVSSPSVF